MGATSELLQSARAPQRCFSVLFVMELWPLLHLSTEMLIMCESDGYAPLQPCKARLQESTYSYVRATGVASGAGIPIEQRGEEELTHFRGQRVVTEGIDVRR